MAKKSNEKPSILSTFKDIVKFMFKCEFKTDAGRVNFNFGVLLAFYYVFCGFPAILCFIFSLFSNNNTDLLESPHIIYLFLYMIICTVVLCVIEHKRLNINKSNE